MKRFGAIMAALTAFLSFATLEAKAADPALSTDANAAYLRTPATFTVNKLIPGWTEALTLMRTGDKWHIVIPSNLAYGARGAGDGLIPPNQTLVFDMELLEATHPKKEGPDPDDPDAQH